MRLQNFSLIILSLLLYVFAPVPFSRFFIIVCAVLFVFQSLLTWKKDSSLFSEGFISFNIIFSLSAFAVIYVFPLFIYGLIDSYSFASLSIFRDSSINKVTALSTFAFSIYYFVYNNCLDNRNSILNRHSNSNITVSKNNVNSLNVLSIIMVIVFSANIVFFIRSIDAEHNDLSTNTYIAEITKCFLSLDLVFSCVYYRDKLKGINSFFRHNRTPLICLLIVISEYFLIGDRGFIIIGFLMIAATYVYFVKRLKAIVVIPIMIAGIILMSMIGQIRKTDSSVRVGGLSSFTDATISTLSTTDNFLATISDLTLVSNVAYLGYDFTLDKGIYYPERLLVVLAMPIPYAPSILTGLLMGDSETSVSTSSAITGYYKNLSGYYGDGGLGTQMVIDLYASWRLLGVIIGMVLLGYLMGYSNILKRKSIYYLIIYITMFGMAIYLPRSVVYVSYRTIIWELIIAYFLLVNQRKSSNFS